MKFILVTSYDEAYAPLAQITWNQNKIPYADLHGYDTQALTGGFKYPVKHMGFQRLELVVELLKANQHDWIYVIGTDTMITNFTIKLEDLIDEDYDFIISVDCLNLNNDSFLVKNSPLSIKWLEHICSLREQYADAFWLEQSAMIDTLDMMGDKIKIVPQRYFNSYDYWQYPQDYEPHVKKVDILGESGQWEPGDFLIHWPGLTLERRIQLATEKLTQVIK